MNERMISLEMARRRRELTEKLDENTINLDEAKELKTILEEELRIAQATKNTVAEFAIIFLHGMLTDVIKKVEGRRKRDCPSQTHTTCEYGGIEAVKDGG